MKSMIKQLQAEDPFVGIDLHKRRFSVDNTQDLKLKLFLNLSHSTNQLTMNQDILSIY